MRTSACTCPGEDHPGPNVNVGRSSPELDVLEAQTAQGVGQASQSLQTAPYDESYQWNNGSDYVTLYNPDISKFNSYIGGVYQEAISGLTNIPDDAYDLAPTPRAVKFGAQYTPDWDGNGQGSVTWFIDGKATWTVHGTAIGPNADLNIGQRLIPVEPMAIIMNVSLRARVVAASLQLTADSSLNSLPAARHVQRLPDDQVGHPQLPCPLQNRPRPRIPAGWSR